MTSWHDALEEAGDAALELRRQGLAMPLAIFKAAEEHKFDSGILARHLSERSARKRRGEKPPDPPLRTVQVIRDLTFWFPGGALGATFCELRRTVMPRPDVRSLERREEREQAEYVLIDSDGWRYLRIGRDCEVVA